MPLFARRLRDRDFEDFLLGTAIVRTRFRQKVSLEKMNEREEALNL